MTSFASLGVPRPLVAALDQAGITEAFPIQEETLPHSLAGHDVLGRGRTGSGKTIAFALPMLARLGAERTRPVAGEPRGLVLAPTRELAEQIGQALTPLAKSMGLYVTTIYGGVAQRVQERALERGVDIVVACPGRLEDLMRQRIVNLHRVEVTVVDEADQMADMGFLPSVTRIMAATPDWGQRLLFSATLDGDIDSLVRRFLPQAVRHELDESSVPDDTMTHRVFHVRSQEDKTALVHKLASGTGRRILFTRTKHHAQRLAGALTKAGIPAVDLHGNLGQGARARNLKAFGTAFEEGGVRVLVATDVAARGVHVDGVELVVHVDPPAEHKAYLHRAGRTARAGAEGTVVTLALGPQRRDLEKLLRTAGIDVRPENVLATDRTVAELVGEEAPRGERVVKAARGQQRGAGRDGSERDNVGRRGGARKPQTGRNSTRPARGVEGHQRTDAHGPSRTEASTHARTGRPSAERGERGERSERSAAGRSDSRGGERGSYGRTERQESRTGGRPESRGGWSESRSGSSRGEAWGGERGYAPRGETRFAPRDDRRGDTRGDTRGQARDDRRSQPRGEFRQDSRGERRPVERRPAESRGGYSRARSR